MKRQKPLPALLAEWQRIVETCDDKLQLNTEMSKFVEWIRNRMHKDPPELVSTLDEAAVDALASTYAKHEWSLLSYDEFIEILREGHVNAAKFNCLLRLHKIRASYKAQSLLTDHPFAGRTSG